MNLKKWFIKEYGGLPLEDKDRMTLLTKLVKAESVVAALKREVAFDDMLRSKYAAILRFDGRKKKNA